MKELSIEEKVRHYDRALKQIKECTPDENGFVTIYPNEIIPELAESEDERIRKSIIGFLITISSLRDGKTLSNEDFDSKAILEWVAWLEKQAEQKPADNNPKQSSAWSEEDDEMLDSIIEEVRYIGDFPDYPTKEENELYDECLAKVEWLKHIKERIQPKQEWKQENTGDLTDFENAMMHIGGSFFGENAGLDPNDTNVVKEQANFLLGLAQSKEWSEEDKNMLQSILDEYKSMPIEKRNWLKSLRPQNTWKPNDKQMKLLGEVQQALLGKDCHNRFVLFIHELKRLKEE